MKICLVHEEFPEETNFGGIGTYQYTLSRSLSEIGHNITVICRSFIKNKTTVKNGVRIIRIKEPFGLPGLLGDLFYSFFVCIKLIKLQKEKNFDIIESPEWKGELFFFMQIKQFYKTKIIIKLHTPFIVCQKYNNLPNNLTNIIIKFIEKHTTNKADAISSCSRSLIDEIIKIDKTFTKKNVNIIYNPGNHFYFNTQNITDNYNLKGGSIKILFAGSHEKRKGILQLLTGINKLFKINKYNLQIYFVGRCGENNNVNKKLKKEELMKYIDGKYHHKINFIGYIPYKDMKNIYNFMDICIFPSLYDNYPNVVIESLLMKKPTIGSIKTGIVESYKNHKDILFCDPNDINSIIKTIQLLLDDENFRKKLSLNGYKKAILNGQKNINKTISLYKSII